MGQQAEFSNTAKHVTWTIKKFQGNTEQTIRVKVSYVASVASIGSIGMGMWFEATKSIAGLFSTA